MRAKNDCGDTKKGEFLNYSIKKMFSDACRTDADENFTNLLKNPFERE